MRYFSLWIILLLSFCRPSLSQQIKVNLTNLSEENGVLYSLQGEKTSFVDSLYANQDSKFIYNGEDLATGFYQFRINGNSSITFIFSGDNVELKADAENIKETIKVVNSESNRIYYDFVELNRDYKTKTELLQLILARYPKDDEYYQTTTEKVNQLQREYTNFIDSVVGIDSSSFVARYVQSSRLPIVDYTKPVEDQVAYLKSHALDNVDFNDAELIYSDCFTNKSIEHLTYYRNPQLPKELLEQEFQKAVDTLLSNASVNILVYQQIADYLIDGFKQFGFDNVVDYIVENYVVKDDRCLDEETENSIQTRINQSKLLTVGSKAPNIILPDTSGQLFNLNDFESHPVLLLFYSSQCPHCRDIIPKINALHKKRYDFEVVAVSLDEKREDWINFINENRLDCVNVSDLKGWNSSAAKDYYIYATPTMFLIDKERKIILKPTSYIQLKNMFGR